MQLYDNDIKTLQIIEDLYRGWKPNDGQLAAGQALEKGKLTQFIRWGRKGGKTDYIIKCIYRFALLNPGSGCYYFCPLQNQAREILWETGRLQKGIPKKYIRKIKDNDMRIILTNNSFIKLDGSDKYEKHRGTEPHFLVYDEFKDFDPRFHEAIDPNRGVYNCPLIILGTPPVSINEDKNYSQYHELQNQCRRDDDKFYLELSSYVNVQNVPKPPTTRPGETEMSMEDRIKRGRAYLAKKKKELIERGEEYRWQIEYMAKNVTQGRNAVFPMLNKKFLFAHDPMMETLLKDEEKLEWFCIADPGTSTVFGVLFICMNPYSREIFVLDEIYEKDRNNTSTRNILPKIHAKMRELAPNLNPEDDWIKVADEAAAWFINEAVNQADPRMNLTFVETQKIAHPKEQGISLIKDTLLYGFLFLSDRVDNDGSGLYWEMEQYVCIDGKYPKHWDHLIDDLRYFYAEADYDMILALEAKRDYGSRRLRSADDVLNDDLNDDWMKIYEQ